MEGRSYNCVCIAYFILLFCNTLMKCTFLKTSNRAHVLCSRCFISRSMIKLLSKLNKTFISFYYVEIQ